MRTRRRTFSAQLLLVSGMAMLAAHSASAQDVISDLISPGPLSAAHGNLDGAGSCTDCHKIAAGVPNEKCMACHDPLTQRIRQKAGFHGLLDLSSQRCIDCHTEHKGRDFDTRALDLKSFDHSKTGWLLRGKHEKAACRDCHKAARSFLGASAKCDSCHKDPHAAQFPNQTCDSCHGTEAKTYKLPQFDHSKARYPLVGEHRKVQCQKCHEGGKYKPIPFQDCASCHKDPHRGQFAGRQCASCHTPDGWKLTVINHDQTRFPLQGAHAKVACESCHKQNRFRFDSLECKSCHQDPHRGQFAGRTCESCHTAQGWKITGAAVDHDKTRFPLLGAHTRVACESCHKSGRYRFEKFDCKTCHQDPHRAQFGAQACQDCHTQTAFKPSNFDHGRARYELTGRHQELQCRQCHEAGRYKPIQFEDCAPCHNDPHRSQFVDKKCAACHSTQGWKIAAKSVDHSKTRFPLLGAHAKSTCESCHKEGRFRFDPLDCKTCHQDPHKGQFGKEGCETCHGSDTFKLPRFDHSRSSFRLDGKHAAVPCASCHQNGQFRGVAHQLCSSCHKDVHKGQFDPKDCATCHTAAGWKPPVFDHNKDSSFPLLGEHRQVRCQDCHKEGRFKPLASDCASCHQNVHKDPRKAVCEDCHSPANWKPREFPHDLPTFRLEGQHSVIACVECHKGGVQAPRQTLSPDCATCHRDVHQGQLGTTCDTCHTSVSWAVVRFEHPNLEGKLVGVHKTLACRDCHERNVYKGQSSECLACHQAQFLKTTSPNHQTLGFVSCKDCHSQVAWQPATFDHSRFPLRGGHAGLECTDCHRDGRFQGTSPACQSCHRADYDRTTSPNHRTAGMPLTCEGCHTTNAWRPAALDHTRFFPLEGAHRTLQCDSCHRGGVFAGTPSQCVGCHQAQYNSTTNPNHVQSGLPTSCESCHSTTAWRPASFDHARFFPLEGAHRTLQCDACHRGGVYTGAPSQCVGCHQAQYNSTSNPNHVQSGFPTSCESCHSTTAWRPASFDHARFFPLEGAHRTLQCDACHRGGVYAGTPSQCVGCHQAQYNSTSNPNHSQSGFPTTCNDCHSTNAWRPASFDHDRFFPVPHHGINQCQDCHTTGNSAQFSCIDCHEHERSRTDSKHREVSGYQYNSQACLNCHPRGQGDR